MRAPTPLSFSSYANQPTWAPGGATEIAWWQRRHASRFRGAPGRAVSGTCARDHAGPGQTFPDAALAVLPSQVGPLSSLLARRATHRPSVP
jgi:hypothetical protein